MIWTACFSVYAGCLLLTTVSCSPVSEGCPPAETAKATNNSCPAGTGLQRGQQEGGCPPQDTCLACPSDTFNDGESIICRACSPCSEDAQVTRACTNTVDTECRCPQGHFWEQRKCRPCDLCPHGWGVSRQCTSDRNTVCRRCPPGTYSGVLSGTRGCVLCSVCREDQLMLQECNRIQDTICIDKNSNRRYQLVEPRSAQEQSQQDMVSHYEPEVIPVYCTVLLPIVLGLLAYFLLRWRLRRTAKKSVVVDGDSASVFRQDALLLAPAANNTTAAIVCKQNLTKVHLSQLTPQKRQDLEAALNLPRHDGKDWKSLAWQLGYSEQQCWPWSQSSNPAGCLLCEWSQYPGATVEALSHTLFQAGRLDLVWLLQPTCDKLFPSVKGDIV